MKRQMSEEEKLDLMQQVMDQSFEISKTLVEAVETKTKNTFVQNTSFLVCAALAAHEMTMDRQTFLQGAESIYEMIGSLDESYKAALQ